MAVVHIVLLYANSATGIAKQIKLKFRYKFQKRILAARHSNKVFGTRHFTHLDALPSWML
jgi:hypothetical protein